jgi:hypothetical protein
MRTATARQQQPGLEMKSPLEMEPILQGFDLSTLSSDAMVSSQSLLMYASRSQIKLQAFSLLKLLLVLV